MKVLHRDLCFIRFYQLLMDEGSGLEPSAGAFLTLMRRFYSNIYRPSCTRRDSQASPAGGTLEPWRSDEAPGSPPSCCLLTLARRMVQCSSLELWSYLSSNSSVPRAAEETQRKQKISITQWNSWISRRRISGQEEFTASQNNAAHAGVHSESHNPI